MKSQEILSKNALETACTDLSDKEKVEISKEIHDSPTGGHTRINRKYRKLKQFINCQGMKSDVEKFIRMCEKCQKNKVMQCHLKMQLVITDTPSTVYEMCSIDIIGPFCPSRSQHRCTLTVEDYLSKFLISVPLVGHNGRQVAKAFVDHVVLTCGKPQVILSDCGSQFLSETSKDVCILLGIKRIQSTSFRPQSNGSNGRSHKYLIEYFRSHVAADLSNWGQWVKCAVFVNDPTPHSATSYMSFHLLFGRLPNLPGVLLCQPPSAFYAYDTYVKEMEGMLQSSYVMARRNSEI